jgi:hypothetical protein
LTLAVNPTNAGVITSCPSIVRVDSNTPGYTLLFKSSSSNLAHTSIPGRTVPSTNNGNPATPSQLDLNSWGFALPNQTLTDYGTFDTTYTQRTNSPYATATDRYAAIPTTDKEVKHLYTGNYNDNNTVVYDDETEFYYGAAIDLNTLAGNYKTTIIYTAIGETIPCQWDNNISFEDPNCVEPSIACVSGPAFKGDVGNIINVNAATWAIGDTGIAYDTRGDGQEYCIGKLADDDIWMLNNLKLGSFDEDTLLTPLDTNVTDDWILPQIDNSATGYYFNAPHLYAFVTGQSNNYGDFDSTKPNSEETDINSPNFAGYYNWCAATAGDPSAGSSDPGYTCTSSGTYPNDATQDICPANWRMPTGGYAGEFYALYNAYSDDDNTFRRIGPFRGAFAGNHDGSYWLNQGGQGVVWSASHHSGDPDSAFALDFGLDFAFPHDFLMRVYGFSVRCLLR